MITTPARLTVKGKNRTPNQIAQGITGRSYITHSQVSAFQRCSLAFWFQYVEHAEPESLSAAMVLGTGTHAAIQHHMQCHLSADAQPSIDEMVDVFREVWKSETDGKTVQFSRDDTAETVEALARQMIEAFVASPHAQLDGTIFGIEETVATSLAPDLPDLVGRVDVMTRTAEEIVITDIKTTRTMWSQSTADDHAQQLVLYGEAAKPIARDMGLKVKLQFLLLTKAKTPKVETLAVTADEDGIHRTTTIVRQIFKAMQSGNVYPSPSPINCTGCGYRQRCQRWHRIVP